MKKPRKSTLKKIEEQNALEAKAEATQDVVAEPEAKPTKRGRKPKAEVVEQDAESVGKPVRKAKEVLPLEKPKAKRSKTASKGETKTVRLLIPETKILSVGEFKAFQAKDEELTAAGWEVLRVNGREIAITCVPEGVNASDAVKELRAQLAKEPEPIQGEVVEETALALVEKDAVIAVEVQALDETEEARRIELESVVRENLEGFFESSLKIGAALSGINKDRLYRSTHGTFEDYVIEEFGISRPHAYQLMTAGAVYEAINDHSLEATVLPSLRAALAVSKNVKGLIPDNLNERDMESFERAATKFVWRLIVETAPQDDKKKPLINPAHLESVFVTLRDLVRNGAVEIDGEQIPLSVAQTAFDEQVTQESYERTQRQKQKLAAEVEKRKTARNKPQVRDGKKTLDGLLAKRGLGDASGEVETPQNDSQPTIAISCSQHGPVSIDRFVFAGFVLTCGCTFHKTAEGLIYDGHEASSAELLGAANTKSA